MQPRKVLGNRDNWTLYRPDEFQPGQQIEQNSEVRLREGTAEYAYFIAYHELKNRNNLSHGMDHLASLLRFDPARPEWLVLLENYFQASGNDPHSLVGTDRDVEQTPPLMAIRAYVYATRDSRLEDAVQLLVLVNQSDPGAEYMEAWGLDWLEPENAFESLSSNTATLVLASALNRFGEFNRITERQRRFVIRYANLAERYDRRFPPNELSTMTRAGLLRKAGLFNEALAVLKDRSNEGNAWQDAISLGLVLKCMGRAEDAVAEFRKAFELDPTDVTSLLEAADTWFEANQWNKALAMYLEVLRREPNHDWAKPSALYCEWRLAPVDHAAMEKFPDQILRLADGHSSNERAQGLLSQFRLYTGVLPEPVDGTADLLRRVMAEMQESPTLINRGELSIATTCLESPSSIIAFNLQMAAMNSNCRLQVEVMNIPSPDPRVPVEDVEFLLWQYEGTDAVPGLNAASTEVQTLIGQLAKKPFNRIENWADASRVAARISPHQAREVLAVMVHPPAIPTGESVLRWLPRVQLAAAQVLAHLDDGWEKSMRRRALYSALLGPRDWTTVAAILALSHLAQVYSAAAQDIHEAFMKLATRETDDGYSCWVYPLYFNWLLLPHLFDSERDAIQRKLDALDAEAQAR